MTGPGAMHVLASEPLGAVEKADLVLGSFPPGRDCVGVTELARRCGLAKSTTHRVLQVLEAIGMVTHLPAGYRLGRRLHELADLADRGRPSQVRERLLPHLLDLYEQTHLTVHLGVWICGEVQIADRLPGRTGPCVPPPAGARVAAGSSALGKVFLAYGEEAAGYLPPAASMSRARLDKELRVIRQQGVALGAYDVLPGVICVAAPVLGPRRSPLAAISVSGHHKGFDAHLAAHHVRRAAHAASTAPCPAGPVRAAYSGGSHEATA